MTNEAREKTPSTDQCYNLLKKYKVPEHIIQHSEKVCKVAVFLAYELNKNGEKLNIPLINASALLHDITKFEDLKTHKDHAKTGKILLENLGFLRVGEIVGEHINLQDKNGNKRLSEEEIINYSDKRVMHTEVVILSERFKDLRERYGLNNKTLNENAVKRINELGLRTYELEKRIFSKLDFKAEELLHLMYTQESHKLRFFNGPEHQ
ncbi:MAG: HDIG domain-containing protein [Thermodesulfobacteriota bacterium]|nr:HDIG domain-containing protein [Thermodesulfobacteriota bacterium]